MLFILLIVMITIVIVIIAITHIIAIMVATDVIAAIIKDALSAPLGRLAGASSFLNKFLDSV